MPRIVLYATLKAKPGKGDELAERLGELVDEVADEEGTEQFILHRTKDEPETVVFYEVYRDQDAYDTRVKNSSVRTGLGSLEEILTGPPTLTYLTPVKAKGIPI